MKSKKSLLDVVPVGLVNKAEWQDHKDSLEIRLFEGKNVSAKLIIMKGLNPVINFYEAHETDGKLKLTKKFVSNVGSVTPVSAVTPKSTTAVQTGKKRGPKPKEVQSSTLSESKKTLSVTKGKITDKETKVKSVRAESPNVVNAVKTKVNTPKGSWIKKENFLKTEPLNAKELKLTLEQFVEQYIPIQSQQKIFAILTNILVRYDNVSNAPTLQDVVTVLNDLDDGPKELLQASKNAKGLIPIAYYAALIHLFSNHINKRQ